MMATTRGLDFAGAATGSLSVLQGWLWVYYSNPAAAARMAAVAAAVAVGMFDRAGDTGVGGIATMSADNQRPVEVGEAGCMFAGSKFAGESWKHRRVCRQLVGDRKRMLQLISKEMWRSVGRD